MQTLRILWAAMMGSVTIFAVLCFVLPEPAGAHPQSVMLVVLGVAAVGSGVASFLLPANQLKVGLANLQQEVEERPATGDDASMFGGQPATQKVFKHPKKAFKKALMRYQTGFILSVALSEAVALFGFVLSRVGFSPVEFLPFFVAGLVLVAIRMPNEERIIAMFEKGTGIRFVLDKARR